MGTRRGKRHPEGSIISIVPKYTVGPEIRSSLSRREQGRGRGRVVAWRGARRTSLRVKATSHMRDVSYRSLPRVVPRCRAGPRRLSSLVPREHQGITRSRGPSCLLSPAAWIHSQLRGGASKSRQLARRFLRVNVRAGKNSAFLSSVHYAPRKSLCFARVIGFVVMLHLAVATRQRIHRRGRRIKEFGRRQGAATGLVSDKLASARDIKISIISLPAVTVVPRCVDFIISTVQTARDV